MSALCGGERITSWKENDLNLLKSKIYHSAISLWIWFSGFCLYLACSHMTSSQPGKVGLTGNSQALWEVLVIQCDRWHAALWVTAEKSFTTAWWTPAAEGGIFHTRHKTDPWKQQCIFLLEREKCSAQGVFLCLFQHFFWTAEIYSSTLFSIFPVLAWVKGIYEGRSDEYHPCRCICLQSIWGFSTVLVSIV